MTSSKLKELALKATPGKRKFLYTGKYGQWFSARYLENEEREIIDAEDFCFSLLKSDGDYIEAANPDAILALIERHEKVCEAIRLTPFIDTDPGLSRLRDALAQFGPDKELEGG